MHKQEELSQETEARLFRVPFSSPPEDFTPRSMTPSLALSFLLWKDALWRQRDKWADGSCMFKLEFTALDVELTSPFHYQSFLQKGKQEKTLMGFSLFAASLCSHRWVEEHPPVQVPVCSWTFLLLNLQMMQTAATIRATANKIHHSLLSEDTSEKKWIRKERLQQRAPWNNAKGHLRAWL